MSIVDRFSRRSARHGTLAISARVFRKRGSGRRGIYGISNDHGYVPSVLTGVALTPSGGLAPPSRYDVQRPAPFHDQRLWSVAWIRRCSAGTISREHRERRSAPLARRICGLQDRLPDPLDGTVPTRRGFLSDSLRSTSRTRGRPAWFRGPGRSRGWSWVSQPSALVVASDPASTSSSMVKIASKC